MKVYIKDLDKDIRAMGVITRIFMSSVPKKRKTILKKTQSGKPKRKKDKKHIKNIYLERADKSELRLLVMESERKGDTGFVPGILWMHGGGYATGTADILRMTMPKVMLRKSACVIIAPEYRLSVEKPYPAALEDCYQALLWMREHAKELGIRDDQIFVGGESAGGGLAVALCLYARDKGKVNIAFQMPIYPMLDDRGLTKSMKDNNAPLWNEKQNKAAWKLYLADCKGEIPKYAAPARETDYSRLPPAVTYVGGVEAFRDETVQYVENLRKEGIPVAFRLFPGSYHCSEVMAPWAKASKEAIAFFMEAYIDACQHTFCPQDKRE